MVSKQIVTINYYFIILNCALMLAHKISFNPRFVAAIIVDIQFSFSDHISLIKNKNATFPRSSYEEVIIIIIIIIIINASIQRFKFAIVEIFSL